MRCWGNGTGTARRPTYYALRGANWSLRNGFIVAAPKHAQPPYSRAGRCSAGLDYLFAHKPDVPGSVVPPPRDTATSRSVLSNSQLPAGVAIQRRRLPAPSCVDSAARAEPVLAHDSAPRHVAPIFKTIPRRPVRHPRPRRRFVKKHVTTMLPDRRESSGTFAGAPATLTPPSTRRPGCGLFFPRPPPPPGCATSLMGETGQARGGVSSGPPCGYLCANRPPVDVFPCAPPKGPLAALISPSRSRVLHNKRFQR